MLRVPAGGILLSIPLFALLVGPIAFLIFGSFWSAPPGSPGSPTLSNYAGTFSDPLLPTVIINTVGLGIGTAALSVAIGTALSLVIARTNTPLRGFFWIVPLIPLVLPSVLDNVAWLFLLSPQIGLVNIFLTKTLGLQGAPFNIFTLPGIIWVMGLSRVPWAYIVIASSLRRMDPSLEEGAILSGASPLRALRTITLPAIAPAILSAFMVNLLIGLSAFEAPVLLGGQSKLYVLMSWIYYYLSFSPPAYGRATALASVTLLVVVVATLVYYILTRRTEKYAVVAARGYRPGVIDLGWKKYLSTLLLLGYLLVAVVMPLILVFLISLVPFYTVTAGNPFSVITAINYVNVLQHPFFREGLVNSMLMGVGTGLGVILLGVIISYVGYKSNISGRKIPLSVSQIPLAAPSILLALGLIWMFISFPVGIYGTIWMLLIGYGIHFIPYGVASTSGAVIQISNQLYEASKISGASTTKTIRYILIPLIKPALAGGFLYLFIISLKEVGMAVILSGPGTVLLSAVLFDFFLYAEWLNLAALSMMIFGILIGVVLIGKFLFKVDFVSG